MMALIYVDHAATTPLHPQVINVMHKVLTKHYGNPSSIHSFGREAKSIMEQARRTIAHHLGVQAKEIVFTSGGTEADNLAILGIARAYRDKGKHILSSQAEHHAVLHALEQLERDGFEVTYLPVDQNGQVRPEQVEAAIRPDTILASFILVNNETGVINPIEEIGRMLKEREIIVHTDAVQALGALPLDLAALPVDAVSFSAHKINGPKGVGCLYIKDGIKLHPLLYGGSQERLRRAGTENVPGVAGFAEALKLVYAEWEERTDKYRKLKADFLDQLAAQGVPFLFNGDETHSVPHIVNLSFPGVKASTLLTNLDLEGVAASSGSACTAGSLTPSHVILAMYHDEKRAQSAVRFSFGLGNTGEEMKELAEKIATILSRLNKQGLNFT